MSKFMSMASNKKGLILVVDDIEINRIILETMLEDNYSVVSAVDGRDAIEKIFQDGYVPDVILLDIVMPHVDGYQVLSILKSRESTANIPVIIITAEDSAQMELKALHAGAVDYITKPFVEEIIHMKINNFMELVNYRKNLEQIIQEQVAEITKSKDNMIESMANVIEYRNMESGLHVKRMSAFSGLIVNHLLNNPKYSRDLISMNPAIIERAASLHDVGKIVIPDSILLKPGKLTPEEMEVMKSHTIKGSQVIEDMMKHKYDYYFQHCFDIALHHHERWDGTGYPYKLKGEYIPITARIVAIADVYDALITRRVYKDAMSHDDAMNIIIKDAGTHFDPNLVEEVSGIHHLFKACSEKLEKSAAETRLT